jgi:putative transcriptional regulator
VRYRLPRTIGRCQTRRVFTLLALSLFTFTVTPLFVIAQSTATLGKGKFLVASRELNDPNFAESVILLLDYNENGALGVIINRPTDIALTELLPEVKALQKRKDIVYIGGPIARHMVMLLTQTPKPPQDAQKVFADIYLLSQQSELDRVLQSDGKRTRLRAYVGYAGWAAGQLDMEVARGSWLIVPAEAALIFDKAPAHVWPELIRRGEAQWTLNHTVDPSISSLISLR